MQWICFANFTSMQTEGYQCFVERSKNVCRKIFCVPQVETKVHGGTMPFTFFLLLFCTLVTTSSSSDRAGIKPLSQFFLCEPIVCL